VVCGESVGVQHFVITGWLPFGGVKWVHIMILLSISRFVGFFVRQGWVLFGYDFGYPLKLDFFPLAPFFVSVLAHKKGGRALKSLYFVELIAEFKMFCVCTRVFGEIVIADFKMTYCLCTSCERVYDKQHNTYTPISVDIGVVQRTTVMQYPQCVVTVFFPGIIFVLLSSMIGCLSDQ